MSRAPSKVRVHRRAVRAAKRARRAMRAFRHAVRSNPLVRQLVQLGQRIDLALRAFAERLRAVFESVDLVLRATGPIPLEAA